jgi:hypothetical protein
MNRFAMLGAAALFAIQVTDSHAAPALGSYWSGTIMLAKNQPAAMKGLAVTLGTGRTNYVVYDLDTMRMAVAWSGEFLEFGNTLTKIEWPPPPSLKGTNILFETQLGPGWADATGSLTDPRELHQGPLPGTWAHHTGFYVHGDRVVLRYGLGDGGDVLETADVAGSGGANAVIRTIQFVRSLRSARLLLASGVQPGQPTVQSSGGAASGTFGADGGGRLSIDVSGIAQTASAELRVTDQGHLVLDLMSSVPDQPIQVAIAVGSTDLSGTRGRHKNLRDYIAGGPARWTETITTQGKVGTEDGPYQVDTLTEPSSNPYGVSTFFGGFDFLPDGRAAICTFHGDVWVVSGIDDTLEKLTWKRFASGLFQPLGLKVVNGDIYVAGRDQITILRDINNDGEADAYENFNNDTVVTPNYHEFVLDLHTDAQGNFYYAKGAPWEPAVTSPHQGTILKVSPDGKKLEVVATGLRAPNGMTVGPDGTILVGDNQGHWMPSSKLNLVRPGSFLGMVPAAQKSLTLRYTNGTEIVGNPSDPAFRAANKLKGWDAAMPIPAAYDEPICWLPMRWDNSSGGQVFVTSDRWGPWKGAPLFMSYGKCLLYAVLWDEVGGQVQASMVPFGLKFASGVMRGRFNDRDGQLYVCGLKGWQNAATRDGGFYRVRHTGKPVRMPVKAHAASNGLKLTFSCELDEKSAADPGSYAVELWTYRYSGAYGSPEYSVKTPGKTSHDKMEVKAVRLSADKKTVFLEIEGLQPADQYSVRYAFHAADGTELRSEIIGTIHKLGSDVAEVR